MKKGHHWGQTRDKTPIATVAAFAEPPLFRPLAIPARTQCIVAVFALFLSISRPADVSGRNPTTGTYYTQSVSETVSEMDPGSTVRQSEMRFHQSDISRPRVRKQRTPTGTSAHGCERPRCGGWSADGCERPRVREDRASGCERARVERGRVRGSAPKGASADAHGSESSENRRERAPTGGASAHEQLTGGAPTASAYGSEEQRPREERAPTGATAHEWSADGSERLGVGHTSVAWTSRGVAAWCSRGGREAKREHAVFIAGAYCRTYISIV